MGASRKMRVPRTVIATLLLTAAVAGCSAHSDAQKTVDHAQQLMSNAHTCADLVKLSASKLDDIQNQMNDPAQLQQTVRQTAAQFKAQAAQANDTQLKKAINAYVIQMQHVADRAEHGQRIDLGTIRQANKTLAKACT